jgi:putative transcription antitermination factor YqgF
VKILALDIGARRTGCAFYHDATGVPLPLDTLFHKTMEEFSEQVSSLVRSRGVDHLVIGLPLLPSGQEGAQVTEVKMYGSALAALQIPTTFLDERYTTPKEGGGDGDAASALSILTTYLQRNNI